ALAAKSHRPSDGGVRANLGLPLRADLGKIIGENVSGTASIRAMDYDDWQAGKLNSGVGFGNRGVAPIGDLAEKNSCQHLRRELNTACNTGNVISGDHGPKHGGDMKDFELGFCKLLVCHGPIAGAKIHSARHELTDSRPAANALVVDL